MRLGDLVGRETREVREGTGATGDDQVPARRTKKPPSRPRPERDHEERCEERPEGEADVAAYGEERHSRSRGALPLT